jgi:hypothetical protein
VTASTGIVEGINGVHTGPGATESYYLSAHPAITFTVPLALFSQLLFVQAGCAQFPAVALALIVMMMMISGVNLHAVRPKLEFL